MRAIIFNGEQILSLDDFYTVKINLLLSSMPFYFIKEQTSP